MLHRVNFQDETRIFPNENMKISPEFLENFIIDAKSQGYQFISLDELTSRIKTNQSIKKTIVITLDDGYEDNYIHAFPIFRKYQVPFTIYLTTSFINKQEYPWWYKLEYVLLQNDELIWNNKTIIINSVEQKNKIFMEIRGELIKNFANLTNSLETLLLQNNYISDMEENLFLTWQQINEMLQSGLLTIGNHTHTHANLSILSNNNISSEIETSNRIIQENTSIKVKHFCYPYGEINQTLVKTVKPLFDTATTTFAGFINKHYFNHLEQIPRYFLTEGKFINDIISEIAISIRLGFKKKIY